MENYNSADTNNNDSGDKKMNPIIKLIVNHYKNNPQIKSEKQIESEKYLIGPIKFNRLILLPMALISQFVVGSLYSWSVYNKPVDGIIFNNENAGKAPITFYIVFFFFGLTGAVVGPWMDKMGPRKTLLIGGTFFSIAHFLAAVAITIKSIWLLYIGFGFLGGVGLSLTYLSPVSTLQKWFPDYRGFAAGLAVCGFGAGSIAFSRIPLMIIKHVSLPINFVILGFVFYAVILLSAFVFRTPPPNYRVERESKPLDKAQHQQQSSSSSSSNGSEDDIVGGECEEQVVTVEIKEPKFSDYKLGDALVSREFQILYFMFLFNITFGVVAISRLSDMTQNLFDKSKDIGAMVVSVNGAFNLFGRLFFALSSDKLGRKNTFILILTVQCFTVGFLIKAMQDKNYEAFIGLIWISTMCYGASFGTIPAFLNDMFGSSNVGATHGLMMSAWSIAGVGGGIVFTIIYNNLLNHHGYTYKDSFPYVVNYYWIVSFLCIGWILIWFVRTTEQEVYLPPVNGQIVKFYIPIYGGCIRISKSNGFELLSKYKYNQEWNDFIINKYNKKNNQNNQSNQNDNNNNNENNQKNNNIEIENLGI
ncbi:hypothetical protein DICPUDRAFT_46034 [Dictyostelium purpureum]|uniref:Major facilitator superfamily (MFS) profile domain-containing protein n=1 Tax=Dictyostelium purpureum TaxID=5786 RepID=F0ZD78_DICPU|nr:uncharacterized protein DICPUDRAFT_46034 [Dictyostelium purpureum]EGC38061.1 hypothetical protein DICPUDRAFT_46034 [Dictyostelium purpureum]|eukprot:XP_003285368.1 hypothetical protein DICPUDRAFT_46034 [Dictyostelium purpureum]